MLHIFRLKMLMTRLNVTFDWMCSWFDWMWHSIECTHETLDSPSEQVQMVLWGTATSIISIKCYVLGITLKNAPVVPVY